MSTAKRESNIELLRILCIMGIIVLHFNSPSISGGFSSVEAYSANSVILHFLESLFVGGVDIFIIISGYFMCHKNKVLLDKPIMLLVQVIVYRVGISLASFVILGGSIKSVLISFLPVNYFVILYIALYLVAPFVNKVLAEMPELIMKRFIILLVVLFSVWTTFSAIMVNVTGESLDGLSTIGVSGNQDGYTIVTFVMLYLIGAYLRCNDKSLSRMTCVVIVIACVCVLTVWSYIGFVKGVKVSAFNYDNPVVIALSICIFLFFKSINIPYSKVINGLAKGVFGVFLLHILFMSYIDASRFTSKNPFILLGAIVIIVIAVFVVCWVVDWLYRLVYKYTIGRLVENYIKKEIGYEP